MNNAEFEGRWEKLLKSPEGLEVEQALLGVMAEGQTTSQVATPYVEQPEDGPDQMLMMFLGIGPLMPSLATDVIPDKYLKIDTTIDGVESYRTSTGRIVTVISMDVESGEQFFEYHSAYLDHECEEAAAALEEFNTAISDSIAVSLWPEMREAIEELRRAEDAGEDVEDGDV